MNQLQKVKLTLAVDLVESLFPYRFINKPLYGKGSMRISDHSTVYRPSYIKACAKLEKLITK